VSDSDEELDQRLPETRDRKKKKKIDNKNKNRRRTIHSIVAV